MHCVVLSLVRSLLFSGHCMLSVIFVFLLLFCHDFWLFLLVWIVSHFQWFCYVWSYLYHTKQCEFCLSLHVVLVLCGHFKRIVFMSLWPSWIDVLLQLSIIPHLLTPILVHTIYIEVTNVLFDLWFILIRKCQKYFDQGEGKQI